MVKKFTYNFGGETTTDTDMILEPVEKQILFQRAEDLLVGKNAVELVNMDKLNYLYSVPEAVKSDPQRIQEMALADYDNLTFFEVDGRLQKWQRRFIMSQEATVDQMDDLQLRLQIENMAKGMAYSKDSKIFTALEAGAGQTQAAGATWQAAAATPATDIANAIGKIFTNTYITDADIQNINIFYPAKLFGHMARPIEIGALQETLREWVQREYAINLFPTRMLTTGALAVVKGTQTAIHMQYTGSKIPTYEVVPKPGLGMEYFVTSYDKTLVMPQSSSVATSNYICKITGVTA